MLTTSRIFMLVAGFGFYVALDTLWRGYYFLSIAAQFCMFAAFMSARGVAYVREKRRGMSPLSVHKQ